MLYLSPQFTLSFSHRFLGQKIIIHICPLGSYYFRTEKSANDNNRLKEML